MFVALDVVRALGLSDKSADNSKRIMNVDEVFVLNYRDFLTSPQVEGLFSTPEGRGPGRVSRLLAVLGLSNVTTTIRPLADSDRRKIERQTLNSLTLRNSRGAPVTAGLPVNMISESGLYTIVLRAQRSNPAARAFQDWITKIVIPSIRKTGSYIKDEEKVASGELSLDAFIAKIPEMVNRKVRELEHQLSERIVSTADFGPEG